MTTVNDEYDEYDDMDDDISDEDIADLEALEDNLAEETIDDANVIVTSSEDMASLAPDIPVYRIRLPYAHETFLATYRGDPLKPRDLVLIQTRYGRDLAQVIGPIKRNGSQVFSELTWIERPAFKDDIEQATYNHEQEREAFRICKQKIATHNLDMKLVSVHYLLEEPKILFFFNAENRIDFRELVKDLVNIFKARIELRQIGVRDEARIVGGLGICGRGYCCHTVSDKLKPVSIKMAKDQNLSLNSMKISGPCGRLLCCLAYEHAFYNEQRRLIPQEGCKILYDNVLWKVMEVNAIAATVKLSAEDGRLLQIPASQFEKAEGRWRIKEL